MDTHAFNIANFDNHCLIGMYARYFIRKKKWWILQCYFMATADFAVSVEQNWDGSVMHSEALPCLTVNSEHLVAYYQTHLESQAAAAAAAAAAAWASYHQDWILPYYTLQAKAANWTLASCIKILINIRQAQLLFFFFVCACQNEHNAAIALHGTDKESRRELPIPTREKK